jgi:hypothetical protein
MLGLMTEDEVSEALHRILGRLLTEEAIEGFDEKLFQTPVREGNLRNFNGSSIDKQPDFLFRINGRTRSGIHNSIDDGIFIECKPIR